MRSRRIPAAAALVVLGWVAATGVASAHDGLVSSVPADGQSVDESPEFVELEFTDAPQELGDSTAVVVTEVGGDDVVSTGSVRVDGAVVRQELLPDLPDGEYLVAYRVVSSDGHEVQDSTRFYVGAVPPAGAPFGFDEPEEDSGVPGAVIAVGVLVAVSVAAVVVWRSRHRREPS